MWYPLQPVFIGGGAGEGGAGEHAAFQGAVCGKAAPSDILGQHWILKNVELQCYGWADGGLL